MAVIDIHGEAEFDEKVLKADQPVLVDFGLHGAGLVKWLGRKSRL